MAASRLIAAALLAALLSVATTPAAAQDEGLLPDIEDEVMCPICGTTLELSESPQADRERDLIRRLIAQGQTKEEIKDALVAEYGAEVLAVPDDEGFDLAAWLVPGALLLAACAGVAFVFLRLRRRPPTDPEPGSLSEEEQRRLDAELSSYEP